jgi:hypothetical protein
MLTGRIIPLAAPAPVAGGVSAWFIGVDLVATLADGRTLMFQWRDQLGRVYRARFIAVAG